MKNTILLLVAVLLPCLVGAAEYVDWNYPENGVSVKGEMSFVREKDALAIAPCPEAYPAGRLALTDRRGQICGYVTFQRDGGRRSFYVHQVGSGGANKSLVGRFTYAAELTCDASAIACRVKPVAGERVVTFGTPGADALDNDSIFVRETDTLVRFEAEGGVRISTLAPGRFRVVLAGEDDGDYAVTVTKDYFKNRNMPHYKPINRARAPHAPTGWMAWNIYFDQATAKDNLREARIGAKVLKPFGLEYWSIESWQGNSDVLPVAQFHSLDRSCNARQFPQGMKAVADAIRALGFRPGLWIVPWGTGDKAFYEAHKSWFVHEPNGRPTSLWPGRYILDYTNDEAYEHVKAMIRSYVTDWGYEFFKIDGMGAGFYWPSINLMRPEIKRTLAHPDRVDPVYRWTHMFREAMGEESYFLACGAALTSPGLEDCDATRIGGDIVDPNKPVTWRNVLNQARATLRRYYSHNIVAWNDPDTLMVDPKALTLEEARVTTTVVGLPGQVMFSGDKLTELPPERLRLVQTDLPVVDTHPMRLYPINDLMPVWNLRVEKPFQKWNVVALFNWGKEEKEISASFAELGLDGAKEYAVYETWTETNLGFRRDSFGMSVPAHAVRLFVVHERQAKPIFLASDRHITRGGVELKDLKWSGRELTSVVNVIGGFPMTVRYAIPDGFAFKGVTADGAKATAVVEADGKVLAVTLAAEVTVDAAVRLQFERASGASEK